MATKSPLGRIEPGGKYDIIEELPPMPLKELHGYVEDRCPQCVKVFSGSLLAMPAKNAKQGVIVPGECFVILSSTIVPCMKVQGPGVGHQLIPVPITSESEFALIPNDDCDSEKILNKDWEGTFTDVSKILQLPILPQALYVRSDFNDHKKQTLSRGDTLYNINAIKAGKLKTRRGIEGVSSDGTAYTFLEAEPVDFSSKQIDTKTTLHWFMKVVQFPQRARVFARGACDIPGISNHSEVTFTDHGSDKLLLVKKLGDDPSNIMYINVNSDVKVTAVELKDCEEYDIAMECRQFRIKKSSSSDMLPIRKENKYEVPRRLATESPCEPQEINHPYENYTPQNERDYYNHFDPKPSQTPDKQASRSQLVCGDSKEVLYSEVYDVPLKDQVKISNSPGEKKKSSTDARSGCELKQASSQHQLTSVANPSLLDQPSDIHLRHYVTDKIGKDWGRLATYLELDYSYVEQTTQDVEEQCFRILMKWKRGKGAERKTWEVLLKKLDNLGRKDISDNIRMKIENGTLDDF